MEITEEQYHQIEEIIGDNTDIYDEYEGTGTYGNLLTNMICEQVFGFKPPDKWQ